jgi:hypothetical protein
LNLTANAGVEYRLLACLDVSTAKENDDAGTGQEEGPNYDGKIKAAPSPGLHVVGFADDLPTAPMLPCWRCPMKSFYFQCRERRRLPNRASILANEPLR